MMQETLLLPTWAKSLQEERLEFAPEIEEEHRELARRFIQPGEKRILVFEAEGSAQDFSVTWWEGE
jgi:hypothetical protein